MTYVLLAIVALVFVLFLAVIRSMTRRLSKQTVITEEYERAQECFIRFEQLDGTVHYYFVVTPNQPYTLSYAIVLQEGAVRLRVGNVLDETWRTSVTKERLIQWKMPLLRVTIEGEKATDGHVEVKLSALQGVPTKPMQ